MRILHTADWHLKDKLGWIDRTEDINRSLREIAQILLDRQVEVMIVAGDIFREHLSKEELREAVSDLAQIFGPWLANGGTILAVAGNHDNRAQLETLRDALKLAPGAQRGRIHIFTNADLITLRDVSGQQVQFVCLPYPDEAFARGEWTSAGEINRNKQAMCQRILANLKLKINTSLKTVFISHIHVYGVPVGSRDDHQLSADDDVQITTADLPFDWAAYLAFGHIHKMQPVTQGTTNAYYSGSIERLDAGEKNDEKGVYLLDVVSGAIAVALEWIPLSSVSIIQEILVDGEVGLTDLTPDADSLVRAVVRYVPGQDNFSKIKRHLRDLYPRIYAIVEEKRTIEGTLPVSGRDLGNVHNNIREYLRHAPNITNREAVLKLVEEILI